MGVIFLLSSIPGRSEAGSDAWNPFLLISPTVQNLFHVPVYTGLAWLWCQTFNQTNMSRSMTNVLAILLTIGYGVLDEWHQYYVPGRYASLSDLLFDAVGAIVGVILYRVWRRRRA
jgi:VanZ family protein